MPDQPPPPECANCGARIPRDAKACPDCGADERTGWREASIYDGLELPDTAYESESEGESERRPRLSNRVNGLAWYWWVVGVTLLVLLVSGAIALR